MLQGKAKIIKLAYDLTFIICSIALAFLLILQVLDIYLNGGANPYTVEAISSHFNSISIFVYFWLALVIIGFVIYNLFPVKEKPIKNDIYYTYSTLTEKLYSKPIADSEEYTELEKGGRLIFILKLIVGVLVSISSVFTLIYLFNPTTFINKDQNSEVAVATLYILPFIAVPFLMAIAVWAYEKRFIIKSLPKARGLANKKTDSDEVKKPIYIIYKQKLQALFENKKFINGLRLAVLTVGVTLLIFGLATNGNAGVLSKAITICRQCIGLG